MAIKKQNKALLIFVLLVLLSLFIVLSREGKINHQGLMDNLMGSESDQVAVKTSEDSATEMSQFGDPVEKSLNANLDQEAFNNRVAFKQIIEDLGECLNLKPSETPPDAFVGIETFILSLQTELGPPSQQYDRWMNWNYKTSQGYERRLRLEVIESDSGILARELYNYALDRQGNAIPIDLPESMAVNPSDDVISEILKGSEVFLKERAALVLFPGGERVEYLERNEKLSELEFSKGESFFRCSNLTARESCSCIQ